MSRGSALKLNKLDYEIVLMAHTTVFDLCYHLLIRFFCISHNRPKSPIKNVLNNLKEIRMTSQGKLLKFFNTTDLSADRQHQSTQFGTKFLTIYIHPKYSLS